MQKTSANIAVGLHAMRSKCARLRLRAGHSLAGLCQQFQLGISTEAWLHQGNRYRVFLLLGADFFHFRCAAVALLLIGCPWLASNPLLSDYGMHHPDCSQRATVDWLTVSSSAIWRDVFPAADMILALARFSSLSPHR